MWGGVICQAGTIIVPQLWDLWNSLMVSQCFSCHRSRQVYWWLIDSDRTIHVRCMIQICHSHWHKQETNCCFTVLCLLSVTSFIICCLEIFIYLHTAKKIKKAHWRWEWLSLGWQLERLKYLLTDCFLAELHQLWHQPGIERDISQQHSLSSYSYCSASGVGSEISW